jgi:hypothetical protein
VVENGDAPSVGRCHVRVRRGLRRRACSGRRARAGRRGETHATATDAGERGTETITRALAQTGSAAEEGAQARRTQGDRERGLLDGG